MNATVSDGRFAVIADVSVQVEQVKNLPLSFRSQLTESNLKFYYKEKKMTVQYLKIRVILHRSGQSSMLVRHN